MTMIRVDLAVHTQKHIVQCTHVTYTQNKVAKQLPFVSLIGVPLLYSIKSLRHVVVLKLLTIK